MSTVFGCVFQHPRPGPCWSSTAGPAPSGSSIRSSPCWPQRASRWSHPPSLATAGLRPPTNKVRCHRSNLLHRALILDRKCFILSQKASCVNVWIKNYVTQFCKLMVKKSSYTFQPSYLCDTITVIVVVSLTGLPLYHLIYAIRLLWY